MEIKTYIANHPMANYLYAILVKPLNDISPAFPLCLFGTDNKFTSKDVLNRWTYIAQELKKVGVNILGMIVLQFY